MESESFSPSTKQVVQLGLPLFGISLLTSALIIALYAVIPVPASDESPVMMIIVLTVLAAIYIVATMWAAMHISRAKRPVLSGTMILSVMLTTLIILFALSYLTLSITDPTNFNVPLDKISALYFTMTILATVGFGDIHATSHAAMIAVMIQMVAGLTLFTVVARILVSAVRDAAKKKNQRSQSSQ